MFKNIGVGALIFNERGGILLMRRTNEPTIYKNCWFIPCGKVKNDETPRKAIKRELKEELSVEVEILKEIYNKKDSKNVLYIGFLCKLKKGVLTNLEPKKCSGFKYFPLNNLPRNTGKKALEIIRQSRTYYFNELSKVF